MSLLGLTDNEAMTHALRLLRQLQPKDRSAIIRFAEALNAGASVDLALRAVGRTWFPDDEGHAEAASEVLAAAIKVIDFEESVEPPRDPLDTPRLRMPEG